MRRFLTTPRVLILAALVLAVLALTTWALTGREWPLLVSLVILLAALAWSELRGAAWRRTVDLIGGVSPMARQLREENAALRDQIQAMPAVAAAVQEMLDAREIEPLGQDDYAELLMADRLTWTRVARSGDAVHCNTCHARAVVLSIAHPIWDGPFHGGGSGRCDVREIPVCPRCDRIDRRLERELGLWPVPVHLLIPALTQALATGQATGRPIRLPWLNTLPVRLREELYERPAFHNLMVRVERAGPPPPPAPSRQPHAYVVYGIYGGAQAQHEPPVAHPDLPCQVCEQPYAAAVHRAPEAGQAPGEA